MNCQEVRDRLSAFYDGELPSDAHAAVAEHVAECPDCAQELAAFSQMTEMTGELRSPEPPEHIWRGIERQLDEQSVVPLPSCPQQRRSWATSLKPVVLAAGVLLAIGVSWFVYETSFDHGNHDHQFAAEFGEYLKEFRQNPEAAQRSLIAKYEGRTVDLPEQAMNQVGYRPVVADGLPDGYTLESAHVLEMPCCTCVQAICQRDDGTRLAIFDHNDDDTEWFGGRPKISAQCNGKKCSLIELDDQIAAIWRRGTRHITLVGVRDVTEVSQFVASFDEQRRVPVE